MARRTELGDTALLVDVGGVLLFPNVATLTSVLGEHGGVTDPQQALRAVAAAHQSAFPTHGDLRSYYDFLPAFAGVPADMREAAVEDLKAKDAQTNQWHMADPAAKEALAGLATTGCRIAIVSSADGTVERMLRDAEVCQVGPGPGVEVQAVLDSTHVGLDKPDPAFFLAALEILGRPPEKSVHVGDTVPADVEGARAAGIRAFHYDPYGFCDDPADHDHVITLTDLRPALERLHGT